MRAGVCSWEGRSNVAASLSLPMNIGLLTHGVCQATTIYTPGKPAAYSYRLLSINCGLLWGVVACHFGLLSINCGLLWGVVACHFGLLSINCGLLWGVVACYFGLLSINDRLLWGIVVCCFRPLGFPGTHIILLAIHTYPDQT